MPSGTDRSLVSDLNRLQTYQSSISLSPSDVARTKLIKLKLRGTSLLRGRDYHRIFCNVKLFRCKEPRACILILEDEFVMPADKM